MLDYHAAIADLLRQLEPVAAREAVPLSRLSGRVLAEAVAVRVDAPPFDNSAMDGYALCDPDGTRRHFRLVARIAAGDAPGAPLAPGQCARIFTGAPLPAGTHAVAPQEIVTRDGETVTLSAPLAAGSHIRRRAEEMAVGDPLLPAGTRLDPAAVALLAGQGIAVVPVHAPLKVTVFSSGDELTEPGQPLAAGGIYDANRFQLLAWLTGFAVEARDGGRLPDEPAETRRRLAEAAADSDVILTSGGVSVGEEDHVRAALEAIGTLTAWKLAIKPGKPFAWGRAGRARVFMLPGNPVATFVTFYLMVAPALRRLGGERLPLPAPLPVSAGFARQKTESRREFLRVRLTPDVGGGWCATPLAGQGSAMLSACAAADALLEVPPGLPVNHGDRLDAWLLQLPRAAGG